MGDRLSQEGANETRVDGEREGEGEAGGTAGAMRAVASGDAGATTPPKPPRYGDAAGACYAGGEIQVEVPCPDGGQAALDDGEAAPAGYRFDGPLDLHLTGFAQGSAVLSAEHRRGIGILRERSEETLKKDPRAADQLPPGPTPWWKMISAVEGTVSPEGSEARNAALAHERAEATALALMTQAAQSGGDMAAPALTARPPGPRTTPRSAWPELRGASVEARLRDDIFDHPVVRPPDSMADAAGAVLASGARAAESQRALERPSGAGAGGKAAPGRPSGHEVKLPEVKLDRNGVKVFFVAKGSGVGDTLTTEMELGASLEKEMPLPISPLVYGQVAISASLSGSGRRVLQRGKGAKGRYEGSLGGKLEGTVTLNLGTPPTGVGVIALYGGATLSASLVGVTVSYDEATKQWDVAGLSGAIKAAIVCGVKAQVNISKDYLPSGWTGTFGGSYEYKPGGDYELVKFAYGDDGFDLSAGADVDRLAASFDAFFARASQVSVVPQHHMDAIMNQVDRGQIDSAPWSRHMGSK
ncbi:MAG: hypothetical protein U1F43_29230 [Myxococcota bacterium]